jgi:FAD:protein FMN transferase
MSSTEVIESFDCFGSVCSVLVTGGPAGARAACEAALLARRALERWHAEFSRFLEGSELSRLNADPRETVPVSALMARLARAVLDARSLTRGLVDGTLLEQIEAAGYVRDLREPLPLAIALKLAPTRKPAAPVPVALWRGIEVDLRQRTVTRAPGVKLDSGGLAKGLFADVLAQTLSCHERFAVDCAGDLAVGGAAAERRAIKVASPFDGRTLHTFQLASTGVATSGIGRRSWLDRDGRPAHHLLDPATGEPAFTGIVQATALAPSALRAEIYAKAAVLAGPRGAASWLPHGGVLVFDDGSHRVIEPPSREPRSGQGGVPAVSSRTPVRPRSPSYSSQRVRVAAPASLSANSTRYRRPRASRHNARDARDPDRQRDRSRDRARARRGT